MNRNQRSVKSLLWVLLAGVPLLTPARTLVLDAQQADQMAAIHEQAQRLSWAAYSPRAGQFDTVWLNLNTEGRFLIRFDFTMIPKGQRITHAELSVPVTVVSGTEPRLFLWRMQADWGVGVCHTYSMTEPKLLPWGMAGAKAPGRDRALTPTAVLRITSPGQQVVNVTEDVSLWYLGAAPSRGWMLSVEDEGVNMRLPSPAYETASDWRLLITYEPQ